MPMTTIGYENRGRWLLAQLLLLCHAAHRASGSLQNVSFVESLRDGVVAFQTLTKWVEHPQSSVMCKALYQGQTYSQIMRAQRDVIKQ